MTIRIGRRDILWSWNTGSQNLGAISPKTNSSLTWTDGDCDGIFDGSLEGDREGILDGDNAFHGCKSLSLIEIPNSVTTMGDSVFFGCTWRKQFS
jgi:hypothetical protein